MSGAPGLPLPKPARTLPERYFVTELFQLWRHCERFGIDPRGIDTMEAPHRRHALAYEKVRREQEGS